MNDAKYIGLDVHQATISAAVLDSTGKWVFECIMETKAATILQLIHGLRGSLHVTFEEGTCAPWLHDLLKPQVTEVLVCNPRKNALLKVGNKNDRIDARKLAELLRSGLLSPVYHGENGVEALKELARSYLTVTNTHRVIAPSGCGNYPKPVSVAEPSVSTSNSTRCGLYARRPGRNCWCKAGNILQLDCFARFPASARFRRVC